VAAEIAEIKILKLRRFSLRVDNDGFRCLCNKDFNFKNYLGFMLQIMKIKLEGTRDITLHCVWIFLDAIETEIQTETRIETVTHINDDDDCPTYQTDSKKTKLTDNHNSLYVSSVFMQYYGTKGRLRYLSATSSSRRSSAVSRTEPDSKPVACAATPREAGRVSTARRRGRLQLAF